MKNIRIHIIFPVLWLLSSSLLSQGSWEKVEIPTDRFLKAVHFADSVEGWVAGNGGVILHTSDGGTTWETQQNNTGNDISDIFFLNHDTGWATAFNFSSPPFGTQLLKTTDGGETWTATDYPEENIFMNCVLFLDSLHGWMGGSPHALVRTTDGGESWQQAAIDSSTLAFFPVISITFSGNYGYACGGLHDIAGVIWSTSDGGNSWSAIDVSEAPADEVHEMYAFDSLHVIGIGGDPDFAFGAATIRTFNGGTNWFYEEIGAQGNGFDLDFRTDYEAWAPLGGTNTFVYSLDTGNTWTEIPTPGSSAIFDVHFPDSLNGYAVGQSGAFLKYIPPFPVSTGELTHGENTQPVVRIHPNPFSSKSFLTADMSTAGRALSQVRVSVYDLSGIVVTSFTERISANGLWQHEIEMPDAAPGIYFCRVTFLSEKGDEVPSGILKMILTR